MEGRKIKGQQVTEGIHKICAIIIHNRIDTIGDNTSKRYCQSHCQS
jgi:hypothetical protein